MIEFKFVIIVFFYIFKFNGICNRIFFEIINDLCVNKWFIIIGLWSYGICM